MAIAQLAKQIGRLISKVWTFLILGWAAFIGLSAAHAAANVLRDWIHDSSFAGSILYVVEVCVCIIIHELGHAIAAKLVGWRVHSVAVGPFTYLTSEKRIVVKNRSYVLSGLVTASPPPVVRHETRSRVLILIGGPAANIVFAVLTLPFAVALVFSPDTGWMPLFGSLPIVSLSLGVANLVPFGGVEGLRSDGLRLIDLMTQKIWPARFKTTGKAVQKAKRKLA